MYYIITTNNEELAALALEKGAKVVKTQEYAPSMSCASERRRLTNEFKTDEVRDLLNSFLMKPNLKGYDYLRFVLDKCAADSRYHHKSMTKVIYPECAKNFGTTPSRVERAIRHCIEASFEKATDRYEIVFQTRNEKPTNSEFISKMSNMLNP